MENDTPRCLVILIRRTTRMLKSLGVDLSPNGRQVSMYRDCFYSVVRRCLSAGCTGKRRDACLISTFAKRVLELVSINFATTLGNLVGFIAEGACHLMIENFSFEVVIYYLRMKKGTFQDFMCTF